MKKNKLTLIVILMFVAVPVIIFSAEINNLSVTSAGMLVSADAKFDLRAQSPNRLFACKYRVSEVSDEIRTLRDFQFFRGEEQLYSLRQAPGSDVEISNQGYAVFFDHRCHFRQELTLHFYSKQGMELFSKKIVGGSLFGFSPRGYQYGVGNGKEFWLIDLTDGEIKKFPAADQFAISKDDRILALAYRERITIYENNKLQRQIEHGLGYVRKMAMSSAGKSVAAVGKKQLRVFSLDSGELIFSKSADIGKSFCDLKILDEKIIVGVQTRGSGSSRGEMQIYDLQGQRLETIPGQKREFPIFESGKKANKTQEASGDSIPWMFFPFDSMRTAWNYYEQHMGWGNFSDSYLHQGLDIIVPIAEPVYAVEGGIVKCVLTLGGFHYWRVAIAKEQSAGWSNGWLYAHLIYETINVAVGDTIKQHDYIGDIVDWTDTWGHIHFVQISDSGEVWRYDDNEWGINFNPLQVLRPIPDTTAPEIENVFTESKFAFPANNADYYLNPDSLYGDVDIVAKITDKIGDSPWDQPAYETFYWIKKLPEGQIVVPKTLGQRLNHKFDFYASGKYTPYAPLIYKRDEQLLPPSWMSERRNFYCVLTNNNGDEFLDLTEENLALHTADFVDGQYRIFVEARDINGNSSIDSMEVKFKNGVSAVEEKMFAHPARFRLEQNYPNPFNPTTAISFSLPQAEKVAVSVFDIQGRHVREMKLGKISAGEHQIIFDGSGLPAGIYFYRLKATNSSETRKMAIVR
ncbi:MAG: T9SS type A sorting domain-containing protein [Calditrichaeota bacterium]|nr:T9SS type A sorting domain-containing protein [Calditrichota bacterium]